MKAEVKQQNFLSDLQAASEEREVVIKRGYLDEDEFLINLPEGYIPESLMLPVRVETKFGTYSMSILPKEPGIMLYKRKLLVKSGQYPKEDYDAYRDFRKTIARYDNTKIILTKKQS